MLFLMLERIETCFFTYGFAFCFVLGFRYCLALFYFAKLRSSYTYYFAICFIFTQQCLRGILPGHPVSHSSSCESNTCVRFPCIGAQFPFTPSFSFCWSFKLFPLRSPHLSRPQFATGSFFPTLKLGLGLK